MPALPTYLIEPIWEQFSALLPERETDHPLSCHRRRISDGVVFEKLVQILVFGCAYERIADEGCSDTTLGDGGAAGDSAGGLRSLCWPGAFRHGGRLLHHKGPLRW